MDVVFLILLTVTFANAVLAGFVLWHNPQAEVNRVFALTAVSTALWTLTNAIFRITLSLETATFSAQVSYLAAVVLGASILHFSWTFPLGQTVSSMQKIALWAVALMIGLLSFIPSFVIRSIISSETRSIETTPAVYLIAVFLITTIGWAFFNFMQRHASLQRVAREQSRYVLVGLGLATITGLICNLLLPLINDYRLVWLGPASSLFFVTFTVYAILAHHLFDIRFIIKKTLVYSLLVAAVGAGYGVAEHSLTEFLERFTENFQYAWLVNIIGALMVAVCFAPLKTWLERQVSRLIYRDQRDHQKHQVAKLDAN